MAKKIIWSVKAHTDRREVIEYWIRRNKSNLYSKKLNELFREATVSISKFPKIGKPTRYKDTRIKIIRDYLMVYKEYDSFISIIAIWDSRQDPLKLENILS